jgi:hypothetical protein
LDIGDDEYDIYKAQASREMKKRLGIGANPLDNVMARVSFLRTFLFELARLFYFIYKDDEISLHVPILPQSRLYPIPNTGW